MRLSVALFFKKMPNGHIWRGKHRLVPIVHSCQRARLLDNVKREERNMLLLRHPFLTQEQSYGHCSHKKKHEKWIEAKKKESAKFIPNVHLEEMFGHLRHGDSWEK